MVAQRKIASNLMQATNLKLIGSAAVIGLAAFGAPDAKALQDTQLTPGVTFTIPGSATTSGTAVNTPLSFAKFNSSKPPIPANRTNIVLTDYRYVVDPASFSGQFTVGNNTVNPVSVLNISGTPSFMGLGNLLSYVNTAQSDATFTSGTNPVAPFSFSTFDLSGSAAGYSSWQSLGAPLSQYIGSTGTVDSNSYFANWAITPSGAGLVGGPAASAQITGKVSVEYRYTYDLIPSATTPGPLPLLGAGAAFGWTRRLRKRISATV